MKKIYSMCMVILISSLSYYSHCLVRPYISEQDDPQVREEFLRLAALYDAVCDSNFDDLVENDFDSE